MSGDEDEPPIPGERTVFVPATEGSSGGKGSSGPSASPDPDPDTDQDHISAPDDEPSEPSADMPPPSGGGPSDWRPAATVFAPVGGLPEDFARLNEAASATAGALPPPPPAQSAPAGVAVGAILNHIYQVRRLIARGGMGEVYEGFNVNNLDERVAIKVILPHLAADPNVLAMFRKEAGTLTRLAHPALVQYRVLAQDPALGVLFIAAEFIDGVPLADVIGQLRPNEAELRALMRRLAEGLAAAHVLGAVHRDIAPDNILLPDGRLEAAKIIDFGIAKDLDTSKATIVGDGFAGKLGFVAPEQFGDFGREIGPWTDVYSLALVMLALAQGRPVDMGATLVDAIDRRRHGPDISAVPPGLQGVFARMLAPDPKNRFRSMAEVIAALDARPSSPPAAVKPVAPGPLKITPGGSGGGVASLVGGIPRNRLVIGGVAALVVLALVVGLATMLSKSSSPGSAASVSSSTQALSAAPPTVADIDTALHSVACSWLEVDQSSVSGGSTSLKLKGAAGDPAAAQRLVGESLRKRGFNADIDVSGVAPVEQPACATIDALRTVRAAPTSDGVWITPKAAVFHFANYKECSTKPSARTVIDAQAQGATENSLSLLDIDTAGKLQPTFIGATGLSQLKAYWAKRAETANLLQVTPTSLQLSPCTDQPGYTGLIVVRGPNADRLALADPSLKGLFLTDSAVPDPGFPQRFEALARANGWHTQMAWFRVAPKGE
jgi:serine/threonine protein kinase